MPQPTNINFLSGFGFSLELTQLPSVNYFIQKVSIPGLNLGVAPQATPLLPSIPRPSRLTFNDLTLTFKVDESLVSYTEIWNWMVSLGEPESFHQYKKLLEHNQTLRPGVGDTMSDGTITVYSNKYKPLYRVIFHNIFPITLSELTFDTTQTDVTYLNADVTFKYMVYEIEKVL